MRVQNKAEQEHADIFTLFKSCWIADLSLFNVSAIQIISFLTKHF